jgi:hypothetical protein
MEITEANRPLSRFEDESLIADLRVASDDVRVYNGALRWSIGIGLTGELVRAVAKDAAWAKRISIGTRIVTVALGVGGFIARSLAESSEDSIVDEIASRYGTSGHRELVQIMGEMDKDGHRGAMKVHRVVDERTGESL